MDTKTNSKQKRQPKHLERSSKTKDSKKHLSPGKSDRNELNSPSYSKPLTNTQRTRSPRKFLITLVALGALSSSEWTWAEQAGSSVGLYGVYSLEQPKLRENGSSVRVDGKESVGGGIAVSMYLNPNFEFETGLYALQHSFKSSHFGPVGVSYSSRYLQIPALIRWKPSSYVSLGAGAYYNLGIQSWNVSTGSLGETTFNSEKNSYGVMGAFGGSYPISENVSLAADLRYAYAMNNSSKATTDQILRYSTVQILAGAKLHF